MSRTFVHAIVLLLLVGTTGCSRYMVYLTYPQEHGSNIFTDRPASSIYVAAPTDLRPDVERDGKGVFLTQRFPADERLDLPASTVVRRALMQDLLQTRVARLVHNPENADYVLSSQILSMTASVQRKPASMAVPLLAGAAVGAAAAAGADVGHGIKVGLVGVVLGTFIPVPTDAGGVVEVRLELRDRATDELIWETLCTGEENDDIYMSLSSREDKKLAERYLPRALKRANACAVGQLYQFLQQQQENFQAASSP